jgi:hypothetical protein
MPICTCNTPVFGAPASIVGSEPPGYRVPTLHFAPPQPPKNVLGFTRWSGACIGPARSGVSGRGRCPVVQRRVFLMYTRSTSLLICT